MVNIASMKKIQISCQEQYKVFLLENSSWHNDSSNLQAFQTFLGLVDPNALCSFQQFLGQKKVMELLVQHMKDTRPSSSVDDS